MTFSVLPLTAKKHLNIDYEEYKKTIDVLSFYFALNRKVRQFFKNRLIYT